MRCLDENKVSEWLERCQHSIGKDVEMMKMKLERHL